MAKITKPSERSEVKAVIFDVDGTLVDSRDLHVSSWKKAFSEEGFELGEETIQRQMGRRKPEIVEALLPEGAAADPELRERIIARKTELYLADSEQVNVIAGAGELIRRLHAQGIRVALATSATSAEVAEHIRRLGVERCVDTVLSSDDVERSKPDPEIVLRTLENLGVGPEEAVVVGDSPHDVEAARAAGVKALGVLTGGYPAEDLSAAGADEVYDSVAQI